MLVRSITPALACVLVSVWLRTWALTLPSPTRGGDEVELVGGAGDVGPSPVMAQVRELGSSTGLRPGWDCRCRCR